MNSCRVIQKAIRCLGQQEVCKLMTEFHDKVMTFIYDPNGNHVIQRSIQVMSGFAMAAAANDSGNEDPELAATTLSDQMQFIVDDIMTNVEQLSTHRYGCRVVQRAVQHCVDSQKFAVLEKIISCHEKLIIDQYGKRTWVALASS
jgi:pumilio RNA-binding family